jgi:hypothetical protein
LSLLDAIRVVTELEPRGPLPARESFDPAELADVLEAHGLAPIAAYNLEYRGLGGALPDPVRERLLGHYQGVVNDNVFKLVSLKGWLKQAPDVPVALLDAAAYVDWLYPHLAFRPVGELRLAASADDGPRLAKALAETLPRQETREGGHALVLSDGRIDLHLQEGAIPGRADPGLFRRGTPVPAFGPSVIRPAPLDALIACVADLGRMGLHAPLIAYLDLRELVRHQPELERATLLERAQPLGLERALYGALGLLAHYFPAVAERAEALRPPLASTERLAVDSVMAPARDPAHLRRLRGGVAAARWLVAPGEPREEPAP